MSLPTSEPLPPADDSARPPRRGRRRLVIPAGTSAQSAFLRELAHRMSPSFDFYLFTILAGLALVTALLFDSPALFVLTALLSPFMAPVAGMAFSTILASGRYFVRMCAAAAMGALIIFASGALAGWLSRLWPGLRFDQAYTHVAFTWPDLVVLLLGAGLTAYALVRAPGQRPLVTSVAMAYEIYLPAGAAGFGLTSGLAGLWPQGLVIFALNLSLAVLMGALTLVLAGLRPLSFRGHLLGAALAAVALAGLLLVNGSGMALPRQAVEVPPAGLAAVSQTALPEPSPRNVAQATAPAAENTPTATATRTETPAPARTATNTLVPSRTPTITDTPVPTPAWAFIAASSGGGALIRTKPGFNQPLVKTLINGLLVEVLPEVVDADGVTWVKIRTPKGDVEGWIVRSLLTNATPAPGW